MKAKIITVTMIACLICVSSSTCWPASYFVSASAGNDKNTGLSSSSAWKSIAKVNTASFAPGDKILFRCGDVWRETLTPPASGTFDSPLAFGSYGSGSKPVILGSDARTGTELWKQESPGIWYAVGVDWKLKMVFHDGLGSAGKSTKTALSSTWDWWHDSTNSRIYIYNLNNPGTSSVELARRNGIGFSAVSFIIISNLEIAYADNGIGLWGGSNWTIDNVHIHDVTVNGIQGNNGSRFLTVQNSTFEDWNWHGYLAPKGAGESYMGYGIQALSGASGTPSDQWKVSSNKLVIKNMASGEDSTAINFDQQGHASLIEKNYIDGKGTTSGGGIMFWRPKSSAATVIKGNTVTNSGAIGINISEFHVNNFNADVVIERNVVSNSCLLDNLDQEALRVWTANDAKVIIGNNLISRTAKGQYYHNGLNIRQSGNVTIFNNTIYGADIGINVERNSNAAVVNNIAAGNRIAALNIDATSTCTEKSNDLHGAVTGITPASTTLALDPLFVAPESDNFRLNSMSPAAAAGINMGTGIYDLDGVMRPSTGNWSMGAYQKRQLSSPTNLEVQ